MNPVDDEPFEAHERLIAVFGNRLPFLAAGNARPAPLPAMTVPVADQQVNQARGEKRARVGARVRAFVQELPHLLAVDDLDRTEGAGSVRGRVRILLEGAEQSAKVGAEVAQERVVGQHHHYRLDVQDAGCAHDRRNGDGAARQTRRDLVLQNAIDEGALVLGRQDVAGVFVEAAERVVATVGALHCEAVRLLTTHAPRRREAARDGAQVEFGDADRGRPQITIVSAEEEAVEGAGFVVFARHHRAKRWSSRRRGVLLRAHGVCQHGAQHECDRRRVRAASSKDRNHALPPSEFDVVVQFR